jgi:hypothetical protein
MKLALLKTTTLAAALAIAIFQNGGAQTIVSPPNFAVTTPGNQFSYVVNGQSSPSAALGSGHDSLDFSLNAGATYIFQMNSAGFHPVNVCTNPVISATYSGLSLQSASGGTIVTLTIPPTNYPPTLYYICSIHGFYGQITVNPPQPPPTVNILNAAISTNIVLTFSGGTNTIQLIPQFSSNLVSGAWLPVPSYTNTFSGGATNTTSFNRLDAVCGPNVFLRISQAPN